MSACSQCVLCYFDINMGLISKQIIRIGCGLCQIIRIGMLFRPGLYMKRGGGLHGSVRIAIEMELTKSIQYLKILLQLM